MGRVRRDGRQIQKCNMTLVVEEENRKKNPNSEEACKVEDKRLGSVDPPSSQQDGWTPCVHMPPVTGIKGQEN
jgi:hypothetical protein